MSKINEDESDHFLYKLLESKNFKKDWKRKKINDQYIQPILNTSSKAKTGNQGEPDFIYKNENSKLLILIENKAHTKHHQSINSSKPKPQTYAVDGVKHYLSYFKDKSLLDFDQSIQTYLEDWKFVGIATSGNVASEFEKEISTFVQ